MAPLDSPARGASLDADNPWLGLASFSEETQAWFFGRNDEVAELARRVQRKVVTLLFGKSGLGKTSILRAGIVPRLRPLGYCPVYLRIDHAPGAPAPVDQIKDAILRATAQVRGSSRVAAAEGESLWEFLHHRDDVLRDASGKAVIPLLIFDQFEEIFTLAQADDAGRARAGRFLEELADVAENRPPKTLEARIDADESLAERFDFARSDYRILIALREDYLAHLESLKALMPSITQNRMRLAPMTGAQALEAVTRPGGRLVSGEVAEAIVRFIAGGAELRNAEVEPSLLSLICRELNNARIAQGRSEISVDLLAGSHDTILAEFYERALADQPPGVRRFIEDELLTESGFRESVAEERVRRAFATAGAAPDALATLVDRRLLRIEERLDVRRVELTHDVLCGVVRASRDLRKERDARDAAERQLVEQQARERQTRKALVRARQVAAICGVLAIAAIGGAFFGYESMKRAQRAEAQASQTRAMAESARGEAEKLIVYLLDDFNAELEPIGRLDIVAELAKRALAYYDALPAQLRSRETERNRALALVRYGAVLRTQAKLNESERALSEGIATLERLRREGDHSELNTLGLSLGLTSQAGVHFSANRRPEGRRTAQQAVDLLKPLVAAGPRSPALLRAYGMALFYRGYTESGTDDPHAAETLEQAREAFRSIDGLTLENLPAAASFAEATGLQVDALQSLGRTDDALKAAEDATTLAGRILERRPGYMPALRARGYAVSLRGDIEADRLNREAAVAANETAARDWEAIVRIDPTNTIAWNNFAASKTSAGDSLYALGRIDESRENYRIGLDVAHRTKLSSGLASTLAGAAGALARLEAEQGNRAAALEAQAESARLVERALSGLAADAPARYVMGALTAPFAYEWPRAQGDFATVRTRAHADLASAERAQAANLPPVWHRAVAKVYYTLAEACYRLNDLDEAERAIRLAQDHQQAGAVRGSVQDRLTLADQQALAAVIAARRRRFDEARATIAPALALQREMHAGHPADTVQRMQLAHALYASALANPGTASADLREASAILEHLPPAVSRQASVKRLRDDIAEESVRQRRAS